ncbi:MAG: protoporphyrinogen oxidase HemJ [Anaerolineales bacterium]
MEEWLTEYHLWLRALHIIFTISWMAGLLYLPRLFVYHCTVGTGSEASEMLKVMERRLEKAIMTPAMIASLLFGGLLLVIPGLIDWGFFWVYFKLAFVVGLTALHFVLMKWRREFAVDGNRHQEVFYRVINEMPTLLMIGIVIFAVVKPF